MGSGSGVFKSSRRFLEALRDLFDGVALGGLELAVFISTFDVTEVGVLAGELGDPLPFLSCDQITIKFIVIKQLIIIAHYFYYISLNFYIIK